VTASSLSSDGAAILYRNLYGWLDRELGPPGVIGVSAVGFVALSAYGPASMPWLRMVPLAYLGGYALLRVIFPIPEIQMAVSLHDLPPSSARF
jgi:hypothetical protein